MELGTYESFIHQSRYARYVPEHGRRETWGETVARYCNYWYLKYPDTFPIDRIFKAIYNMEVMPSMRALMTAGKALDRDNMAGFNCSYAAIDDLRAFDEILYILMCGTGVGFSVERQSIVQLPILPAQYFKVDDVIVVRDSKGGWADALRKYINYLYAGQIPVVDTTKLRPEGAPLKTFGGRSSGPAPFRKMLTEITQIVTKATSRRLTSVECHDIVCIIAAAVVVGGVRRSALISLSNLTDERMRRAKSGDWREANGQRELANNSVAYTEKPDIGIFMDEWKALYESKSGERGIFNRVSAERQAALTGRRELGHDWGTNPCGEIILRPNGLCNLSEVIVRDSDTVETLAEKVEIATIIGTYQSTLTNFRYVRKVWQKNAEEERLLGVSMTGIMDNELVNGRGLKGAQLDELLESLKNKAIGVNAYWAKKLGIPVSAAITTVKPSGTVSQLTDSASGIHPRFAPHYIRNVRNSRTDPISDFMVASGVPNEVAIGNESTLVFSFPKEAPKGAIYTEDVSAVDQLNHYLSFKRHWCEHNPSITIYVKEHEWLDIAAIVYREFDDIGGVSFLPFDGGRYEQMPYTEITEEAYNKALNDFPVVDWSKFIEGQDNVVNTKELACVAGYCEI